MNYKKIVAGAILLSATVATSAFAQTSAGVLRARSGSGASTTAENEMRIANRAGAEIANRIDALNALEVRVNAMQRLSASEKSALASQIQAEITAMNDLQAQITADENSNSTSGLKTDVQSITKAYRIYALVLPQGMIAAASDRVMAIANAMTTLSGALQARVTTAQNAGANMSSSTVSLADLNAKVADATAQAQAAMNSTASLAPDNGNTTVMTSNTAALKAARTDIQAAQKDLVAARQDASTIIAAIKAAEKSKTSTLATTTP